LNTNKTFTLWFTNNLGREKTQEKLGLGVECAGDLLEDGPLLV
jgi:hypothetical protein